MLLPETVRCLDVSRSRPSRGILATDPLILGFMFRAWIHPRLGLPSQKKKNQCVAASEIKNHGRHVRSPFMIVELHMLHHSSSRHRGMISGFRTCMAMGSPLPWSRR